MEVKHLFKLLEKARVARLLLAGLDERIVHASAGHKTATEQYRVSGLKELAEAVRKLHPRG